MFQYAFGRYLSIKHNTDLKLDVSDFKNYTNREFELNVFNLNLIIASESEIQQIMKPKYFPFRGRDYFGLGNQNVVLYEDKLSFELSNFKTKRNTYIAGYWQSEKYFNRIRDVILNDFNFGVPRNQEALYCMNQILSEVNSVSVHIRRGDYVENSDAFKFHGVLPLSYYLEAISIVMKKVKGARFYFFSDDIDWVIQNFKHLDDAEFIDFNKGKNSFEDMRLMSLCRHNIIANSSFSWWAAWLNSNPNKIVIAPKQWFADTNKNREAIDIVPERWLKI